VLGTAEYVAKGENIYIQGVAVDPNYLRCGVCASLIEAIEAFARDAKFEKLTLCAIEETGNVAIFEKLGFRVRNRMISPSYESPRGGAVTEVEMEKVVSLCGHRQNTTGVPVDE